MEMNDRVLLENEEMLWEGGGKRLHEAGCVFSIKVR